MPDPIVSNTPFGQAAAFPPSPARLDRDLDCQNHSILNIGNQAVNLATNVTGQLPLANIQPSTGPYLLGSSATGSPVMIAIGSNVTLTGNTLAANATGGSGTGDFSTNTSTSVASEIVLFSNTSGKQGMRSTGTGPCQLTSGVLSVGPVPLATGVSGTLQAAQFPALTGAVTTPGASLVTTIANGAVTNPMLAGGITASNLVGSDIATVGTVTNGTWAASPVSVSYGGTGASTITGARAALGIETLTSVGDTNYSVLSTDKTVALNAALTAVRTFTLPQASTVNDGSVVRIVDSVGGVTNINYIQVSSFAGDTISGSTSFYILNRSYGLVQFVKSSSTVWVPYATPSIIRRVFLATQTYTTPVGVKALYAECVGGAGAGGGAAVASSNLSLGSGGSGGAYSSVYISSPLASYLITIGAGGTGVSGGTGNNGLPTSFGGACNATGGVGGTVLAAGTSLAVISGASGAGAGGGDIATYSSAGGNGIRLSGSVGISGQGGPSSLGLGGGTLSVTFTSPGFAGTQYGAGGGGALTTGAAQAGGNGASGMCLVTEYY